jgi:hypothetical protein
MSSSQNDRTDPTFVVPEYVKAFGALVNESMHEFAALQEPMLGQIPRNKVHRMYQGRNSVGEAGFVQAPMMPVRNTFGFSHDVAEQCDIAQIVAELRKLGEKYVAAMMPQVFAGMSVVIEAVGNTFDAEGQPFTWDMVLDMIEKIEVAFDDDDRALVPALHVNENMNIPKMSTEQARRLEEILERKRVAYIAGRRHRELPRNALGR